MPKQRIKSEGREEMSQPDDGASDSTKIAIVSTKIDFLTDKFKEFDQKVSQQFVGREEHALLVARLAALEQKVAPLQKFVYSIITIVGAAIIGAVLKLVIAP